MTVEPMQGSDDASLVLDPAEGILLSTSVPLREVLLQLRCHVDHQPIGGRVQVVESSEAVRGSLIAMSADGHPCFC